MTKSKIFFISSLCFLAGIFLASFFRIEIYFILILLAASITIFLLNYKNRKSWIVSVAILFFIIGLWRTGLSIDGAKNNLAGSQLGSAEFMATVIKEPETDEKYQKVIVQDNEKNKILINTEIYPAFNYGDGLKVKCILEKPKKFEDSTFDYQMYLGKDEIYRICNKAQITVMARNKGNKFYSAVLAIKNKFEAKISQIFPDPEGAYLKGLILGGSKRMTKDLNDAFSRTGTTHTVAVSGYNVTIVAAFLMWLGITLGLWRQQVFSFAVLGIILFVLMTGAPSSAVRAGIMGGLVIWAMKEGRLANSTNAIILAAAIMLAINPLLLRYDAGFQLSFLATLGIVWLYPLFEKKIWGSGILKETILLSVAAQIFVLPILLNSFEKLSIVSPLANLLILPAIPYIMLGGFAAGIAGFIFVPLGTLMGFIPYLLLKIELFTVAWLGNLPWAALEIKNFGWVYMTTYYCVLFLMLFFYKRKSRPESAVPA